VSYPHKGTVQTHDLLKQPLKVALLRLLNIALEGNFPMREQTLARGIQWQELLNQMSEAQRWYRLVSESKGEDRERKDVVLDVDLLLEEQHLTGTLLDQVIREIPKANAKELLGVWQSFPGCLEMWQKRSRAVEIVRKGELELVYFRIPEIALSLIGLDGKPKPYLQSMLDRLMTYEESHEETVGSLLQNLTLESFNIDVMERVNREKTMSKITAQEHNIAHASAGLTLLQNTILLVFLNAAIPTLNQKVDGFRDVTTNDEYTTWSDPLDGSTMHHWAAGDMDAMWGKYSESTPDWIPAFIGALFPVLAVLHLGITILRALSFWKMRVPSEGFRIFGQLYPEWINPVNAYTGLTWSQYHLLLYSPSCWFMLSAVICSLFALLLSPLFCALFMVDVFAYSTTIGTVVLAVKRSFTKMVWLILLLVLFIYWSAALIFQFFWNQQTSYQRICSTLWQCFVAYLDLGTNQEGLAGYGFVRDLATTDTYPRHLWQAGDIFALVIVKVGFFVIVVFVVSAFFQAVIVDTFGELRDAGDADAERLATECFVCGLHRRSFKGTRSTLEEHTDGVHSLISYIFLALHLRRKQGSTKLVIPGPRIWNTQELFLHNCFTTGDASFFPEGTTLVVHNAEVDAEAQEDKEEENHHLILQQSMESVRDGQAGLTKAIEKLSQQMQKLSKQQQLLISS